MRVTEQSSIMTDKPVALRLSFQIELKFRNICWFLWIEMKTGEPGENQHARTRTNNKLNPQGLLR